MITTLYPEKPGSLLKELRAGKQRAQSHLQKAERLCGYTSVAVDGMDYVRSLWIDVIITRQISSLLFFLFLAPLRSSVCRNKFVRAYGPDLSHPSAWSFLLVDHRKVRTRWRNVSASDHFGIEAKYTLMITGYSSETSNVKELRSRSRSAHLRFPQIHAAGTGSAEAIAPGPSRSCGCPSPDRFTFSQASVATSGVGGK